MSDYASSRIILAYTFCRIKNVEASRAFYSFGVPAWQYVAGYMALAAVFRWLAAKTD
jgi:hypothetical protein